MSQRIPVIVTTRVFPPMFAEALAKLGEVHTLEKAIDDATLENASILVASGVDPVDAALIKRFSRSLGLIANIATGTDNIDLSAASARGIAVSNTPVVAEDTADLTMALLLATCRRLSFCENALRNGDWSTGAATESIRVHGKTLGIIGMGAIGQALARRARAFNMNIVYYGPRSKPCAESSLPLNYRENLEDLLSEADIVSLNCPLTPQTRHMINAETLSEMKPGAVLINTGRGPLIDEAALVNALEHGQIGAAGLDVFEFEPNVSPELLAFENVTLLPHIGSATRECRTDMALRAFENIRQFLETGAPVDNVL